MRPDAIDIAEDFGHKSEKAEKDHEDEWNRHKLPRNPAATNEADVSCHLLDKAVGVVGNWRFSR